MYFWAEKYFSGGSMDQQQAGSGSSSARRGSRGTALFDRKSSFGRQAEHHTTGGGSSGDEHRRSVDHLRAPRRESRSREGLAQQTTGGAQTTEAAKAQQQQQLQQIKGRKNTAFNNPCGNVVGGGIGAPPPSSCGDPHRGSTLSELAATTIGGGGAGTTISSASVASILTNIARALAVRALLLAHSLLCIWMAGDTRGGDNSVWAFALLAVCLVGEGFYAVVVRAGDDPKWFSPAILLYLFATVPPLWLINSALCPPTNPTASSDSASAVEGSNNASCAGMQRVVALGLQPNMQADAATQQALLYLLFLVLLAARWLLPRAELSREELTQILLAFMAIITDIGEFLGLLNVHSVCADSTLHNVVLGAWTLSLAQFALVLTASRARKMRIAIATKIIVTTGYRADFRQAFYDVDVWAVLISLALQDVPFLVVRLCVLSWLWLFNFGQMLFLAKNALIILVQTYRISVLLNDRYLNPPLDLNARARSLMEERRQSMAPAKAKMSVKELAEGLGKSEIGGINGRASVGQLR